ncbi:S-layer homology domain-containing protein [Paenibacillus sp. FSL F4-0125]|uniref:S-layer homology domain-containing protein n=1 Tax=Paenibacillus sp. FSL F4-0125 TaxID=2954730 RepID=UPI0030F6A30A
MPLPVNFSDVQDHWAQDAIRQAAALGIARGFEDGSFRPDGIVTGVNITKEVISGYKDGSVELTVIEPDGIPKNTPCLIYIHGGAFVLKAAPAHIHWVCDTLFHLVSRIVMQHSSGSAIMRTP